MIRSGSGAHDVRRRGVHGRSWRGVALAPVEVVSLYKRYKLREKNSIVEFTRQSCVHNTDNLPSKCLFSHPESLNGIRYNGITLAN